MTDRLDHGALQYQVFAELGVHASLHNLGASEHMSRMAFFDTMSDGAACLLRGPMAIGYSTDIEQELQFYTLFGQQEFCEGSLAPSIQAARRDPSAAPAYFTEVSEYLGTEFGAQWATTTSLGATLDIDVGRRPYNCPSIDMDSSIMHYGGQTYELDKLISKVVEIQPGTRGFYMPEVMLQNELRGQSISYTAISEDRFMHAALRAYTQQFLTLRPNSSPTYSSASDRYSHVANAVARAAAWMQWQRQQERRFLSLQGPIDALSARYARSPLSAGQADIVLCASQTAMATEPSILTEAILHTRKMLRPAGILVLVDNAHKTARTDIEEAAAAAQESGLQPVAQHTETITDQHTREWALFRN